MVPVLICRCGPTGSAISETRRVVAGVSLDLLDSGLIELLRLQREIQRSLSEFLAMHESTGLLRPTLLMATAFAFGAVHARHARPWQIDRDILGKVARRVGASP